jgi:hypothetical protein
LTLASIPSRSRFVVTEWIAGSSPAMTTLKGGGSLAYQPPPPRPPPPPPEPPENPDELDELRGSELVAALVAPATAEEIERPKSLLDHPPRRQRAL